MPKKMKVMATFTIKHYVEMEISDVTDIEYELDLVGVTLAENGSTSYKESDTREVGKTRINCYVSFHKSIR